MSNEPAAAGSPRERALFLGALERASPAERAAFLQAACAGDDALQQRVEELLRAESEAGSFLGQPALGDAPTAASARAEARTHLAAQLTERAGDRIGRYRLLQSIGEGGCGVVYMAEQEEPVRRRVALKVIKLGMDTRNVIARFEAERQALAMMDHPNIARVLDAGATETGRPYFVMELVRGVRITDYCDQNQLPMRERLELFLQVCQAVQHAHQKGIIHRDLKPSNILVTLHDGVPVPKIIDFGIAKATERRLTDKTLFTEFAAFIGTPAYMSPEQAELSGLDIDTRSDIYSLGVLLYELATGKTPFDPAQLLRAGLDECRRTIREREPARPSTRLATLLAAELTHTANQRHTDPPRLLHQLRGDLDWIVMKCLEKDRTRRYETTNALAADLQRYLEDEPVLARPPSNLYRLRKLLRRHRFAVGATAAVIVTLLAGASISLWQAIRATKAEAQALAGQKREVWLRQQAEEASARARLENAAARLNEYIADINLAQQSIAAGNYGRASQLVEKHRPKPGAPDLRGFEWRYLWRLCRGNEHASLPTQDSSVLSVAFSPDGALAAVGLREQLSIWNLKTGTRLASLPKGAMSLAFLPDGKTLLSASRSAVRRWRTTDWTEIGSWEDSAPIAVSSNGTWLATQARGHVTVWNLETGKEVRSFPGARGPMAFSPEERILATDSRQGVTLWPMKASGEPVVLADSTNLFLGGGPWQMIDRSIAFSPDGQCIVAVRNRPSARGVFVVSIWDAATGQEVGAIPNEPEGPEHTGMIAGLAFSPDGRQLVTASWDHSLRLWDFNTRRLIGAFHGHLNEVWAVAFSPDGRTLLSGAKDGGLCLWPIQPARPEDLLPQGWVPLAFALDSRTLAALHPAKGVVGLINLATHEPEQQFDLELAQPRFGRPGPGPGPGLGAGPGPGPDPGPGRGLGPGSAAGFGGIRSPISGRTNPPGRELKPPGGMGGPMPAFGFLPAIALSANLRVLAQTKSDGTIEFTDTETRETTSLKSTGGRSDIIALSPDARVLIEGKRGEPLRWWELRDRTNALLTLDAHRVLFSPDGRLLAAFQRSNLVELWDVASRSLRTNLLVEPPLGFSVAFSPDGRLLATVADPDDLENAVQLWSTDTANLVGRCVGHKQPVLAVAFAPDGRTLASAGADATIKLWNVATQQELLSVRQSANLPLDLRFSPDGRLLVGTGAFFAPHAPLVVFRAPSPAETEPPRKPRAPQ